MTLREFLNNQGKRAGLNDDSDFAMLLSASALGELEIPESVAQKFESNLLTMDIAKNNLDLKTHFIRNYMMGYDEELVSLAKNSPLSGDAIEEIKATKNSGDKVKLAFKHLNDLVEKSGKSTNKAQSEEYVAKIAEAQAKYDEAVRKAQSDVAAVESKYVGRMQDLWEKAQLAGIAWNENIPESARVPAYKAVINDKLNALGGKVVFDPDANQARIVNAKDESLPLVVSGKEFGYSDLQALVLQENKLLKESGIGGGSQSPSSFGTPNFTSASVPGGTPQKLPTYLTSALADIANTAKAVEKNR
jgi:hypothetical protein